MVGARGGTGTLWLDADLGLAISALREITEGEAMLRTLLSLD